MLGSTAVTNQPSSTRLRRGAAIAASLLVPAVVVVAAVALRAAFLGDRQLFRDEAASWLVASYPFGALLEHSSQETYPPLYQMLLKGWMALFADGEATLRMLSVVASLAGLAAAWRWAKDALGRTGGLIALAIVAVSPIAVSNARDARMYALEATFATLAWWLAWRLAAGPEAAPGAGGRKRWAVAAGLGLAVAGEVWTLALGLPTAALQLIFVGMCWVAWRGPGPRLGVAAVVAGVATLAPWLPALLKAAVNGQRFWTPQPDPGAVPDTFGSAFLGASGPGVATVAAVAALGMALIGLVVLLAGRWVNASERPAAAETAAHPRLLGLALGLGASLVPLVWLYSQIHSIYDSRYLGAALPPLAIAASAGLLAVDGWIRARLSGRAGRLGPLRAGWLAPVVAASLVVVVASSSIVRVGQWRAEEGLPPARQTVAELRSLVQPGDVVLSADARSYFPLAYLQARADSADKLPVPLYDWEGPGQPFYRGSALIDDAFIVDRALVSELGWQAALPGLDRGGTIWLVELARPDATTLETEVAASGELVRTRSVDVEGNGFTGRIVGLRLP